MDIFVKYEYLTKRKEGDRTYVALSDGRHVARYRFVMMQMLDVNFIPSFLHIHHIDGNPLNDCRENLILMKNIEHASLHSNPSGDPFPERRKRNLHKYNSSEKAKNRVNLWKENNKEHMVEYNKKYREDRLERLLKYRREYYLKNRDKAIAYTREWRKINGRTKGEKK